MVDFAPIAFQSSLSTEAVLFGVFGFLYSVYGMYSNPSSPNYLQRPPIVARIRRVCRVIALLILLNAALSLIALFSLYNSGSIRSPLEIILGAGFALTMLVIAIISIIWVFRNME
jgi:hypothetical protein